MRSAVTISLVPEARGGPFVFWDDLAAGCATAAELGFDAVEIFPPGAAALEVPNVVTLLGTHGLKCAAVGTGAGWIKHKLRLTDPDAAIRQRAIGFVSEIIDVAGALGAPVIIGSMQGRWDDGGARDRALDWLGEALVTLAERAAGHGMPLLYKPLNRYETNLFQPSRRSGHVSALAAFAEYQINLRSIPHEH